MPWEPADVVPRRMLELCKDTLKRCLAANIELKAKLARERAESERLRRRLRKRDDA